MRNSGGLYEGGWVRGWREIGGGALVICSMDAAGVVALAVAADACRHWKQTYCVAGVLVRRSCFAARWRCSLGAIVGGGCVYVVGGVATINWYNCSKRRASQCFPIGWCCCASLPSPLAGVKSQERCPWSRAAQALPRLPQVAAICPATRVINPPRHEDESMAGIVNVKSYSQSQESSLISCWAMNKTDLLDTWIIGTYLCS